MDETPKPYRSGFAHMRLDVYRAAQDLAAGAVRLTTAFPRGFADLRDQVNRSAMATVRHIAEGANRTSPADKRARFTVARGEVAECDASLDTAGRLGLVPQGRVEELQHLAIRIAAMLTGLIRRESRRIGKRRRPDGRTPGARPRSGDRPQADP